MDRFTIASMLMVTGIILTIAGWKNFRKAGVPFWRFAPLFVMHKHLHPVGAFVVWLGVALASIGVALRWLPI